MPADARTVAPYLRLLGAQAAIGAAAIFARLALGGAGPLAVGALRLGLAALVALALAGRLQRLAPRRELAFVAAGCALALHFATWIASLLYTSVAISTLLVTTTPVWTCAYEALRARHPPPGRFALALALALGGVALIVSERTTPAPRAGHAFLGDALALAGAFAIGAYFVLVRDAGARHATPLGTRQTVARTYTVAAVALAAGAVLARQGPPGPDASAWGGILGMALLSQALGHTALNAALRDFSPSLVGLATLLEPVVAAILAAALLHEPLGPATLGGGLLVLAGVALALRIETRDAITRCGSP